MTSRLEAKREIEARIREGQPAPETPPQRLPLTAIQELPALFQFREPLDHVSRAHVVEMAKTVQAGQPLDPVAIMWTGNGWHCIDGHHRLKAYRVGRWPHDEVIPVRVFRGTVDQALLAAVSSNAPDKLPMTKQEKMNAAWALVVTVKRDASIEQIARRSCVSKRSVAYMRTTWEKLRKKHPGRDLTELSWWRAKGEAEGATPEEEPDWDEKDLQEAQRMADKLVRAVGKRAIQKPHVLAIALEIYDQRLPRFLLEHWRGEGRHAMDFELEGEDVDF